MARPGAAAMTASADMRRQRRHRPPALGDGLLLGALDLVGRHDAGRRQPVEHAVARRARRGDGAIRAADFRRLRQRHQQRRFRQRQPPRLLAEIGERGGANAFEIAAIGREAEVEREDLVLAQRALELDRAHHLAKLGDEAALACAAPAAARPAWSASSAPDTMRPLATSCRQRAAKRQRIDAAVAQEAPVLVGEQHREEARIDVGARRRQPPAAFRRGVGPQQPAVAVDHQRRIRRAPPRAAPARATRPRPSSRRVIITSMTSATATPRPQDAPQPPSSSRSRRELRRVDCWSTVAHRHPLIAPPSPPSPRRCRSRCGRSGRDGTCPRRTPADARRCPATPPARYRRP